VLHYLGGMPEHSGEITQLLHRWREGSVEAENELFGLVNTDLRRLAQYFVKGEGTGHSVQATELVSGPGLHPVGGCEGPGLAESPTFLCDRGTGDETAFNRPGARTADRGSYRAGEDGCLSSREQRKD
jgi:ECF sigma factor